MTKRLRPAFALTVSAMACLAATATGASTVKLTPVKGATYAGTANGLPISIKVDSKGRSAKISLPAAPAFCSQSGGGPEPHTGKAATISKIGALNDTLTYTTRGSHPKKLATVLITGRFSTVTGTKPVFDGVVKVTYASGPTTISGTTNCSGATSFHLVKK